MIRSILPTFLLLVACNTAGPAFRGIEPVRVEVGGSVFDVRVRDDLAEAIRVSAEWAPNLRSVAPRAEEAIGRASGCDVRDLRGDQAQILARLDC